MRFSFFLMLTLAAGCKTPKLPSACGEGTVGVEVCGYCDGDGACIEPKRECVPTCESDADCPDHAFRGCDSSTRGCVPREGACGSNF